MALTFTQTKATLDDISSRITGARQRMDSARQTYAVAQAELGGLQAAYTQFIADLDAAAAGNTWPLAAGQKSEKDQMVSDFQALKAEVDVIIAAIDAA